MFSVIIIITIIIINVVVSVIEIYLSQKPFHHKHLEFSSLPPRTPLEPVLLLSAGLSFYVLGFSLSSSFLLRAVD